MVVGGCDETSVDRYVEGLCGCEDLLLLHILHKPLINITTKSAKKASLKPKTKSTDKTVSIMTVI